MKNQKETWRSTHALVLASSFLVLSIPVAAPATGSVPPLCARFPATEAAKLIGDPVTAIEGKPFPLWCGWQNRKSGLSVNAAVPGAGVSKQQFKSMMQSMGQGKLRDESTEVGLTAYSLVNAAAGESSIWMLSNEHLYLLQVSGRGAAQPSMLNKLRPAARRLAEQLPSK